MSLDYSLGNIPNFKTRCWEDVPKEQRDRAAGIGKRRMNTDTEALIWGSMLIDLGSIRKNNIEEWCFRIDVLKKCGFSWMEQFDDDEIVPFYPTREAVEEHIGLSTNVSTMTRAKWMNKIKRRLEKEAEQEINRQLTQREKETNQ